MVWTPQWCVLINCFSLWGAMGAVSICVDCGCWPATCWTASSTSEVLVEKSGLDGVCELAEAGDGGVLHFFILLTSCVTVQIHNDFTYLIRRQQTGPFSTRSHTTFHFTADRNTPPSVLQQTFNSLQNIICKLAWRKCFFPLPSKNLLACYKNPSGFTNQTFHSLCKIQE